MSRYDITLVFFNARLHNQFLNIIKYLARDLDICIYVCPYFKFSRTPATNRQFLEYCAKLGAKVLRHQENIETNVLFLSHVTALDEDYIENEVLAHIKCKKKYALQVFPITGGPSGKALFDKGFRRKLLFDQKLDTLLFRIGQGINPSNNRFESIEIGDLNINYPVFDEMFCDYLICIPTKLSFETTYSSFRFFRNMLRLVKVIKKDETIAMKHHTAKDEETPLDSRLARVFGQNRLFLYSLVGWLALLVDVKYGDRLSANRIYCEVMKGVFYKKILNRCKSLQQLHKYANFGAELFLPGVRKGLITGRSSVMWFALKQKIPVFNCDDGGEFHKTKYLNVLQQHYGVPSSVGQLTFDKELWSKVDETEFDFIKFIRNDVQSVL
jgi:hypothetical protein